MDNDVTITAAAAPPVVLEETAFGSKEPFAWERVTLFCSMTIFPEDGHPDGRQVLIGAWTHQDPPLVKLVRRSELRGLPPVMAELLAAVKASLPERERLAAERQRIDAEKAAKEEQEGRNRQQKAAAQRSAGRKAAARKTSPRSPVPKAEEVDDEDDDEREGGASAVAVETPPAAGSASSPAPASATQASLFNQEV